MTFVLPDLSKLSIHGFAIDMAHQRCSDIIQASVEVSLLVWTQLQNGGRSSLELVTRLV